MQGFLSISFSKEMSMFLYMRAPTKSSAVLLHLMVLPLHTSPRNPHTVPSFATKEKPSPLLSPVSPSLSLRVTEVLSLLTEVTHPISSPMDLAESIDAHLPFLPSRNSSVYPLLNVLSVLGVNPPVMLPNDPLTYGLREVNSSNAME